MRGSKSLLFRTVVFLAVFSPGFKIMKDEFRKAPDRSQLCCLPCCCVLLHFSMPQLVHINNISHLILEIKWKKQGSIILKIWQILVCCYFIFFLFFKEVRDGLFWKQVWMTRACDTQNSIFYHETGSWSFCHNRIRPVINQDMFEYIGVFL